MHFIETAASKQVLDHDLDQELFPSFTPTTLVKPHPLSQKVVIVKRGRTGRDGMTVLAAAVSRGMPVLPLLNVESPS